MTNTESGDTASERDVGLLFHGGLRQVGFHDKEPGDIALREGLASQFAHTLIRSGTWTFDVDANDTKGKATVAVEHRKWTITITPDPWTKGTRYIEFGV
jgi:hypothetical protein